MGVKRQDGGHAGCDISRTFEGSTQTALYFSCGFFGVLFLVLNCYLLKHRHHPLFRVKALYYLQISSCGMLGLQVVFSYAPSTHSCGPRLWNFFLFYLSFPLLFIPLIVRSYRILCIFSTRKPSHSSTSLARNNNPRVQRGTRWVVSRILLLYSIPVLIATGVMIWLLATRCESCGLHSQPIPFRADLAWNLNDFAVTLLLLFVALKLVKIRSHFKDPLPLTLTSRGDSLNLIEILEVNLLLSYSLIGVIYAITSSSPVFS